MIKSRFNVSIALQILPKIDFWNGFFYVSIAASPWNTQIKKQSTGTSGTPRESTEQKMEEAKAAGFGFLGEKEIGSDAWGES